MDPKRNCAERMRPILQAMEQSIDAARRQRTSYDLPRTALAATPATTARTIPGSASASLNHTIPFNQGQPRLAVEQYDLADGLPRLKARPKRADTLKTPNPFPDTGYRAQAG